MSVKIRLSIVFVLALLVIGTTHTLADDAWYIFLYNSTTRELVRVNGEVGSTTTFELGLHENEFVEGMDFSTDGQWVALCGVQMIPETPQSQSSLYLRDLEAGVNKLEIDLGKTLGCHVSRDAFNEDDRLLAVGVINYFAPDKNIDTSKPIWQLLVFDTQTGKIAHEINADTPAVIQAGMLSGLPIRPLVRYFADNQIIFAEIPYGIGGTPKTSAYRWHLDTGKVEPADHWGAFALDYHAGELIWVDYDAGLPAGEPGGPMSPFNVVMTVDQNGEAHRLYHSPDWLILNAKFIDDGEQIAIQLLEPFDPDSAASQSVKWAVLGRDGTLVELRRSTLLAELVEAPGGCALLWAELQEQPRLTTHLDIHSGNSNRKIWTYAAPPKVGDVRWEIAGSTHIEG